MPFVSSCFTMVTELIVIYNFVQWTCVIICGCGDVLGGYGLFWVDCFGWVRIVLGGYGLFWVGKDCFGWVWIVLGGYERIVLGGHGLFWAGMDCFGWVWIVLGG